MPARTCATVKSTIWSMAKDLRQATANSAFVSMCARSLNASARSSTTSIRDFRRSRTIRALAIAGAILMVRDFAKQARTFYRTLAVRIIFLIVVFLVVPIIFYRLFQYADVQQSELLEHTVKQKGDLIASVLRPHLENFQNELPDDLQRVLDVLVDMGSSIKVLLRPAESAAPT